MASYIANDADLTLVADAIRSKGKTSDSLVFPNEFVNAIAAISTGGTYNLQSKTITPSTSTQTILPDTNYDALSSVTVESIPSAYIIPTGTKSITANGIGINVAPYATVDVTVPTSGDDFIVILSYNDQTEMWEPDKTYAEIQTAYSEGKHIIVDAAGTSDNVIADGEWHTSSNDFTYVVHQYNDDGSGSNGFIENFYTMSSDGIDNPSMYSYISPYGTLSITANGTNIDVTNYASVNVTVSSGTPLLQSKTITPTESQQTITPDSGYDGLSQVTVGAISSSYVGSGIARHDVSDVQTSLSYTASGSSHLIAAKVSLPDGYYESDGALMTQQYSIENISNIPKQAATTITPTESTQVAANANQWLTGDITVNPIPSTYVGSSVTTKTATTITPGTANQTIASGTYLTGTQTIMGDADLTAANIKTGIQIFGVTGSYTSDATASAADIINGQTGYVNGSKITGSLIVQKYYTGTSTPSSSFGNNGDIWLVTS